MKTTRKMGFGGLLYETGGDGDDGGSRLPVGAHGSPPRLFPWLLSFSSSLPSYWPPLLSFSFPFSFSFSIFFIFPFFFSLEIFLAKCANDTHLCCTPPLSPFSCKKCQICASFNSHKCLLMTSRNENVVFGGFCINFEAIFDASRAPYK